MRSARSAPSWHQTRPATSRARSSTLTVAAWRSITLSPPRKPDFAAKKGDLAWGVKDKRGSGIAGMLVRSTEKGALQSFWIWEDGQTEVEGLD